MRDDVAGAAEGDVCCHADQRWSDRQRRPRARAFLWTEPRRERLWTTGQVTAAAAHPQAGDDVAGDDLGSGGRAVRVRRERRSPDAAGPAPGTRRVCRRRYRAYAAPPAAAPPAVPPDGPDGVPSTPFSQSRKASVSSTSRVASQPSTSASSARPDDRQDGLGDQVEGRDEVARGGQHQQQPPLGHPDVLTAEGGPDHARHGAGPLPHRRAHRDAPRAGPRGRRRRPTRDGRSLT